MKINGLIPATVTPFDEKGSIHDRDLERHVFKSADVKGIYGVAVNGHAGEILSLSSKERTHVVSVAKKALPPGKKLIAGIDGRTVDDLIQEGKDATKSGADALLVLPLFDARPYRKLAQNSQLVHALFKRLNDEIGTPMVIFLYPDKEGCTYPDSVLKSLTDIPNVVAVKAGAGNVTRYSGVWEELKDSISVLAANDSPELLGMLLRGAHGSLIGISVLGPEIWSKMVSDALAGRVKEASEVFNNFCVPLAKVIFENQNPTSFISPFAATKEALYQLGEISSPYVRFPSLPPDEKRKAEISEVLHRIGLISPNVKGRV
ncbi:MAG: dihydrodipicolinate synthase family protein [Candidatus Thermoplasmatota archaeon]|jgi:4-hydroxy-tetrahydrodipicolinate synthase|nr:dihydrodipicolinate synthase family protein [Candidatus Thermoplasmatota archaeon]MCL5788990.1 dihydrodipicolinate synthase family protein [Candidatus Thermoplasmatota archaeon]